MRGGSAVRWDAWPPGGRPYGYRRLTAMLRREGWTVNGKRVRRLMAEMGLKGKAPVRRRRTTDSRHEFPRYPNSSSTPQCSIFSNGKDLTHQPGGVALCAASPSG